jgi:hypothetical protein
MPEEFNLQKFIISIVIIGVVLVVGIYITDSIGDVSKAENTAGAVVNESVTFPANNAVQSLDVAGLYEVSCSAPTTITNQTATGQVLTIGNFTLSGCTITNATALSAAIGNGTVFVSYTYTYTATTDASNSAVDVVSALETGTAWISILVVVGFAVIILTMLTSGLSQAAGRSEVPYY